MKKTITMLIFLLVCGWANAAFDGGDGSAGNPYQVSTAAQLNDVRNFLSSYFIQTADIDLIAYATTPGWVPIGDATTKFTGNYDGGGHKIKHLFINLTGVADYNGLFGYISLATVKNLGVDCNITGNSNTAGLAGYAFKSTIQNCYATGVIYGYNSTGGLVGYADCTGGGLISNCYSKAIVSGYYYTGGLVGEAWRIPFTNCYATGEVISSQTQKGGLVGRNIACVVNDCFWDTETSGLATSPVGTGKTTAEMKTQATFTNWDFVTIPIWNIDTENNGYPHLNWQVFTHNKYYVKTTGSNSNDGLSWANAFLTVQKALETVQHGDQIWVASGLYKPSVEVGGTGARYATFQMVEGVEIYGGFAGTESAVSERLNFGMGKANETKLSGDVDGNDNYTVSPWTGTSENCYHVFYQKDLVTYLTPSAIIDGFTISGGNANAGGDSQYGGAFYNGGASPTIRNCIIAYNACNGGGGGIYNFSPKLCKPSIINCLVVNNKAQNGAGIWNRGAKPLLVNTTIANNAASNDGGAVWNGMGSMPILNNCIIWGNTGGVASTGKQFWTDYEINLNYSCYANGTGDNYGTITASNCITTDPQMVNPSIGDCRIVGSSPCADVGNDAYNSLTTDIRGSGFGRKVLKTNAATTGNIDMGAHEYKFDTDPPCLNASSGGAIAAAQTICSGGDPAAFTSTTPTGQSGSLDYKWQSSTTDATTEIGFLDISPNGTSETYDPPTGLTVSTWYRRLAKATCASDWLAATAVKVTVRTAFNAGSISKSGETICYNGDPAQINDSIAGSGGEGTISYQWQSSTDAAFTSPTTINSNTASYNPPANLTATTWYRRQAKDATCNLTFISSSEVWKVTVRPVFSAGSIKKLGDNVCYNGDPAQIGDSIPASGGFGPITYQWQSSTNAGFTGTPTDIGTNAASYDPPANLTATTWYRRQAKDGTCSLTFTSSAEVWKVAISSLPIVTGDTSVTQGQVVTYSTPYTPGNSYTWNASHGNPVLCFPNHNCLTLTWDFPCGIINPGYVRVTETNLTSGCSATVTKWITIAP
jgi:hypothetical protein